MADVEIPMSAAELQRIRQLDDTDLAFFLHELQEGGSEEAQEEHCERDGGTGPHGAISVGGQGRQPAFATGLRGRQPHPGAG